jgi:hypothetical protein
LREFWLGSPTFPFCDVSHGAGSCVSELRTESKAFFWRQSLRQFVALAREKPGALPDNELFVRSRALVQRHDRKMQSAPSLIFILATQPVLPSRTSLASGLWPLASAAD